jgi:hypothetical protein
VGNHDHYRSIQTTLFYFSTFYSSTATALTRSMIPSSETHRAIEPLWTKFSQVRFQIICQLSTPFFLSWHRIRLLFQFCIGIQFIHHTALSSPNRCNSPSSHDHHIFSVLATPVFYHHVSIDIAYDDDALGMIIRYIQYSLVNFIHTILGRGPIPWPCIDNADSSSRSSSSAIPLVTHWRDAQYFS